MLGARVIHITAFTPAPWPSGAAIGPLSGTLITGVLIILYVGAVIIAVRPRTWQAEDELHVRDTGKHR